MSGLQEVIDKLIDLNVSLLYAISEITANHLPDVDLGCCKDCFQQWPCRTVKTLMDSFTDIDENNE
jgi:hypothetical protein